MINMDKKLRILFVTSEIDPFLKMSTAADLIRLLPQKLQEKGHEIRILMPKFGVINERRNRLHEVVRLSGINIRVGAEEKPLTIKVASIPSSCRIIRWITLVALPRQYPKLPPPKRPP